uniref:Uncharacterized protein n=1 Tax=Anguilla anguilla TaxID=7936 RepID=A0A0E9QPS0_ANGAN
MYLLMNCSKPTRRSSMKDSSKMPSSPGRQLSLQCLPRQGDVQSVQDKVFNFFYF